MITLDQVDFSDYMTRSILRLIVGGNNHSFLFGQRVFFGQSMLNGKLEILRTFERLKRYEGSVVEKFLLDPIAESFVIKIDKGSVFGYGYLFENQLENDRLEKAVGNAIQLIAKFGSMNESHHKAWVIDQTLRILAGRKYEDFVARASCLEAHPWDCGVAP